MTGTSGISMGLQSSWRAGGETARTLLTCKVRTANVICVTINTERRNIFFGIGLQPLGQFGTRPETSEDIAVRELRLPVDSNPPGSEPPQHIAEELLVLNRLGSVHSHGSPFRT